VSFGVGDNDDDDEDDDNADEEDEDDARQSVCGWHVSGNDVV
jgi:hypothetical protein